MTTASITIEFGPDRLSRCTSGAVVDGATMLGVARSCYAHGSST